MRLAIIIIILTQSASELEFGSMYFGDCLGNPDVS